MRTLCCLCKCGADLANAFCTSLNRQFGLDSRRAKHYSFGTVATVAAGVASL